MHYSEVAAGRARRRNSGGFPEQFPPSPPGTAATHSGTANATAEAGGPMAGLPPTGSPPSSSAHMRSNTMTGTPVSPNFSQVSAVGVPSMWPPSPWGQPGGPGSYFPPFVYNPALMNQFNPSLTGVPMSPMMQYPFMIPPTALPNQSLTSPKLHRPSHHERKEVRPPHVSQPPERPTRPRRSAAMRRSAFDSEEESSAPESETFSEHSTESDDGDSDFGPPRRRSKRPAPRKVTRPKPVRGDEKWDEPPPTRRKGRPKRHSLGSDDSGIGSDQHSDGSSDSSYCSGAPGGRKRQKTLPSTEPTSAARRVSSRPSKTQRVNYAALGQNFDSDSTASEDLTTAERSTQHEGPAVDRVLGYRQSGSTDEPSVVPLPLPSKDSVPVIQDYVFFIKWARTSHLHNTWTSYGDLVARNIAGVRKVENFFRRMETLRAERRLMTEDEIEQQDIAFELQKQLTQDSLIAERIISGRVHPVSKKLALVPDASPVAVDNGDDASSGLTSSSPHRSPNASPKLSPTQNQIATDEKPPVVTEEQYFVKWRNTPYDQCTWETKADLLKHGFSNLIEEYELRESRISGPLSAHHPLHDHALSRTSFEPYLKTPTYLHMEGGSELRDYQITGVNWVTSRMKKGLSVLLADEMGLGKTIQTISVIGHLMYAELLVGPFLVIVPQSTADNWLYEFRRWLPEANVIVYHGNPQAREIIREHEMSRIKAEPYHPPSQNDLLMDASIPPGRRIPSTNTRRSRFKCDVVIATPSLLNNPEDLEFLRWIDWYLMAIDEAHLLKNRESKRFKELNLFRTRYRLLLSGTPLHNNLEEMWSLLRFLCPERYNDLDDFKRRFSEIERVDSVGELKEKQLAELQKELHEIVLRRVKKDVEKSLPKKIERILRVEVSPKQAECCAAVIARNYELLAKSTGGSKASLQNICMELKKVCNHPLLLQSDGAISEMQNGSNQSRQEWYQSLLHSSGKLALLDKLLPYLKEKGHRVLIFSQMVRMLNLLSAYLTLRGFRHQRLDGTMGREVRKKAMDHFNAPDSDDFCFLLSTKAGGLGINLTSADTVIIYDSDWNPQNDLQAEARAHRIGQTKTVQIYRLVTKDTVEERILERAKSKMVLDTLVVQGLNKRQPGTVTTTEGAQNNLVGSAVMSKSGVSFTREELAKILKFGATKLWKQQGVKDETMGVDLDKILAEAEERDAEGAAGLADELFNSFTNISDFRYEAPPDPAGWDDKNFWDQTIPVEERLKYEALRAPVEVVGKKRQRKQVERSGALYDPILDDLENTSDGTVSPKPKKKGGKRAKTEEVPSSSPKATRAAKPKAPQPKKRETKRRGVQVLDGPPKAATPQRAARRKAQELLPEDFLSDYSDFIESSDRSDSERPRRGPPPRKRKKTERTPRKKKPVEETPDVPKRKTKKSERLSAATISPTHDTPPPETKPTEQSASNEEPPPPPAVTESVGGSSSVPAESPIPRMSKSDASCVAAEEKLEAKEDDGSIRIPRRGVDPSVAPNHARTETGEQDGPAQPVDGLYHQTEAGNESSDETSQLAKPSEEDSSLPSPKQSKDLGPEQQAGDLWGSDYQWPPCDDEANAPQQMDQLPDDSPAPVPNNSRPGSSDGVAIKIVPGYAELKSYVFRYGRPESRPFLFRKMHRTEPVMVESMMAEIFHHDQHEEGGQLQRRVGILEGICRWVHRNSDIPLEEILPDRESGDVEFRLLTLVARFLRAVARPPDLNGCGLLSAAGLVVAILKFGWDDALLEVHIPQDPFLQRNCSELPSNLDEEKFHELMRDILAFLRYSSDCQPSVQEVEAGECSDIESRPNEIRPIPRVAPWHTNRHARKHNAYRGAGGPQRPARMIGRVGLRPGPLPPRRPFGPRPDHRRMQLHQNPHRPWHTDIRPHPTMRRPNAQARHLTETPAWTGGNLQPPSSSPPRPPGNVPPWKKGRP